MIVYSLDACLTIYWKLFVLGLWVVSLLFVAIHGRRLLRAGRTEKAMQEAGITGEAYEKMKPKRATEMSRLLMAGIAAISILYGYSAFFSSFQCTPDSFLWIAPQYGTTPA
jgi:hypothetical protein